MTRSQPDRSAVVRADVRPANVKLNESSSGERDGEEPRDNGPQAGERRSSNASQEITWRPSPINDEGNSTGQGRGEEQLRRKVQWLSERVENLKRELARGRRENSRLADQLKEEERIGREQRGRADDASREAEQLRQEVARLKKLGKVAVSSALSDARDRSVRMAERRRRQQAESLMQAYKGLYEEQLQTQHASSESHRSLVRAYRRLRADNEALKGDIAQLRASASGQAQRPSSRKAGIEAHIAAERREDAVTDGAGQAISTATPQAQMTQEGHVSLQGASASESAAAVATAAAAVAAAAEAFAAHAADAKEATEGESLEHQARKGCSVSKAASPTDSSISAETATCSSADGDPEVAGTHRKEGPDVMQMGPTIYRERAGVASPPSDESTATDEAAHAGESPLVTSTHAFAINGPLWSTHGSPKCLRHQAESSTMVAVHEGVIATPPAEPAPRWRGRRAEPRRGLRNSENIEVSAASGPKRSASPDAPEGRRWGSCRGTDHRRGCDRLTGNGCTRIEPSRVRPHSI